MQSMSFSLSLLLWAAALRQKPPPTYRITTPSAWPSSTMILVHCKTATAFIGFATNQASGYLSGKCGIRTHESFWDQRFSRPSRYDHFANFPKALQDRTFEPVFKFFDIHKRNLKSPVGIKIDCLIERSTDRNL